MTSTYQEMTTHLQDQGGEEDDEINDNTAGTGRSYFECVFCKRGFTNAQALGGHMNIHRRDRASSRTGSSSRNSLAVNSNYQQQPMMMMMNNNDYSSSMHGGLINSSSHASRAKEYSNTTHAPPRNYNCKYFSPPSTSKALSTSSSSSSRRHNINPTAPLQAPLSLFNEDHPYTNLGLRSVGRHEEEEEEDHEVDLELRLGT